MPKINKLVLLLALLGAAPFASAGPTLDTPRYALTVIGGAGSMAYDVNNHGDVIGTLTSGAATHGFMYAGNTLTDLGTGGAVNSIARHINDVGQVVGTTYNTFVGDTGSTGFLYSGGTLNALQGTTAAFGINNGGTVTGFMGVTGSDGDVHQHGYSYSGGAYTDIGVLIEGGSSYGLAINNHGAITGGAEWGTAVYYPTDVIRYQNGMLSDLGEFDGGIGAYGWSINDRGDIVGHGSIEGIGDDLYPVRALSYTGGALHNLGSLIEDGFSEAFDINNLGLIVGTADAGTSLHGFIYLNGAMIDLNKMIDPAGGWTITDAQAINDAGQIAGTACRNDLCYAVRLDLVSPVPEPTGLAMFGIGAGIVGLARRRGRSARA